MALLVGALLSLLALSFLLLPFLRGRRGPAESPIPQQILELYRLREALYEAIRSLDMEQQLGQVESQEYAHRLQEYRLQAATLLREQEALQQQIATLDTALEREIQEVRESLDGAGNNPAGPS